MNEDLINKITERCPTISRDQIMKRIEKERHKTGGLISDETLLRMIAAEFGCETTGSRVEMPKLAVNDLFPGLNDVTVTGRVLAVFPSRTFGGEREGRLSSLLLADKSGLLRVILWNEKTDLIESGKLKVGLVVRLSHGYTRESGGNTELHLGPRGEAELILEGVKEKDYPNLLEFSTKIIDMTSSLRNKRVSTVAVVKRIFPTTAFDRGNSVQGKVMRFLVDDGTAEIIVVAWNERVDELEIMLKLGDRLQIVNGKLKKALGEGFEINLDGSSSVGLLTETRETENMAGLKEGDEHVNVEGEVATKPVSRDVQTSRHEKVKLATFRLRDDSCEMWVSAWRHHADIASDLRVGDRILIKDAFVRKGFGDELEISMRTATKIEIIDRI